MKLLEFIKKYNMDPIDGDYVYLRVPGEMGVVVMSFQSGTFVPWNKGDKSVINELELISYNGINIKNWYENK